jgi:CrcB protein
MSEWLWVAVAGGVGSVCRWGLSLFVGFRTGGTFPWGTFVVNALGCFVIGIVAATIHRGWLVSPTVRIALLIGFLGGFTTFSSFGLETFSLASRGEWVSAGSYVLLSNVVCLAAVWAGHRLVLGV